MYGLSGLSYRSYGLGQDSTWTGYLPANALIVEDDVLDEVLLARYVDAKRYELKDHLGNVRVVVSDQKTWTANALNSYYGAKLETANDYYPFGMMMPGRQLIVGNYRYGFNGKEDDNETGWQDYGMRMYNPKLGRFFSMDPLTKEYPWYSPYQFAGNDPIKNIDLDGLEPLDSRFKFVGRTAKPKILSQNAVNVLNLIIDKIGSKRLTITSTGRTPKDQARIMFTNLENGTSSTYGAGGQAVIKVYNQLKKQGATDEEIKAAMESKIMQVGPSKVSQHTADPKKLNAIDFGLNGLENDLGDVKMEELKSLLQDLEKKGIIKKFLHPGNNKGEAAYHIEIENKSVPENKQEIKLFTQEDIQNINSAKPDATAVAPIPIDKQIK